MKFRVSTRWNHIKSVILIWIISLSLFIFGFRMAVRYSSPENHPLSTSVSSNENSARRSSLCDKMERDLEENGASFLKSGETSQSLSLSDIFSLRDGIVSPVLKAANPPVRANVLYLRPEFAEPISQAVRRIFLPYFNRAIWFQNSSLYHFSMFHASHHIEAVPASEDEIQYEANAVKRVAKMLCPLKIVLDRVLLTSTGVLLGCWQVTSGTDPIIIRAHLRSALPLAPEKQLYDPALLHTSFARIFGHPKLSSEEKSKINNELKFFQELVAHLNNQIRGSEAVVSEIWYVEEFDVLALALNGRIKAQKFHFECSSTA